MGPRRAGAPLTSGDAGGTFIKRTPSLPALVLVAVLALVVGSIGTAVAGPALSKHKVKKIATKVVQKKAPTLSVANSGALGGQPPAAFQEQALVFTVNIPMAAAKPTWDTTVPLAPGKYLVAYSAVLPVFDYSHCGFRLTHGAFTTRVGDQTSETTSLAANVSGAGYINMQAGDTLKLHCTAAQNWGTFPDEPLQIVAMPLDSATETALNAV
jgi:hypothetical protein